MIHRAEHDRVHLGWLEHRALAERLRVAFYFVACGETPDSIVNPRTMHRSDRSWLENAYNEIIYSLPKMERSKNTSLQAYIDFIKTSWLDDQIKYHTNKAKIERSKNRRFKLLGMWCFAIAIVISLVHLIFAIFGAMGHHAEGAVLIAEEVLSIFAITLPAAGAAFSGYRSLMEHSRIAARSNAMANHLMQMRGHAAINDPVAFRLYLERIEDVMLIESEEWLALMEHAELEKIA
jgi:hypothetical protein